MNTSFKKNIAEMREVVYVVGLKFWLGSLLKRSSNQIFQSKFVNFEKKNYKSFIVVCNNPIVATIKSIIVFAVKFSVFMVGAQVERIKPIFL
jgi:hypothetical protein